MPSPVPGSCTVHVLASRRTVPGFTFRGARRTLIAGARLRLTVPCSARLAAPGGAGRTITGARLAVPGARLTLPGGASHGCQACRPRCQAHGPCRCQQTYRPGLALDDCTASTASQGRGMRTWIQREPTGRMQVKKYCIPERDAHIAQN